MADPKLVIILGVGVGLGTSLAKRFDAQAIVRVMPNLPVALGHGAVGLFGVDPASEAGSRTDALMAPLGTVEWIADEQLFDAVTALSGSGPAYVFYFVEAMMQAAQEMGLSAEQGKQLALGTFAGATALAQASSEPPELLRERVTSKGGTTYAALTSMEASGVKAALVKAIRAAQQRAMNCSCRGISDTLEAITFSTCSTSVKASASATQSTAG